MAELAALGLERKAAAVHAQLAAALARHGRLVYSNSLGAEAMVLTDIIATQLPEIDMFSIDTGRLYEETHELLEKLQRRYRRAIRVVYPDAAALERLVARQGVNGLYHSLEARLECCRIRKVEPFKRAIAGYDGWITGLRREQSAARAATEAVEWDAEHGLYKIVFDRASRRVLGLHVVAPNASDIVYGLSVAMRLGLTVDELAQAHHIFPTFGEGVKAAAEQVAIPVAVEPPSG